MRLINNFNADEKILQFQDKISNYLHGHETLISFELDLTNKCNNRCPKCTGIKEGGAELSLDQISSLIQQMASLHVKSVIISGGGEPTCNDHFHSALYLFKDAGIKIGLNSNALNLSNELFRKAILDCCTYFRVSLDAGTPEMYKVTHGMDNDDFWMVIDNVKKLLEMRESINSETSIGLGYLTGESTLAGIMDFFSISDKLGVDFAQLRPFTGEWINVDEYLDHGHKTFPNLTIRSSSHKYDHINDENPRPYTICHGMYFNTVITADFKMWACIHHRQNMDYFLGDLNNQSIKEILQSDRMHHVQSLVPSRNCPLFCRNDAINRTLDNVCKNIIHKEFL